MNANLVTCFVVALCSLGLSCGGVSAEEKVRTWTRTTDGETCRATLWGKDMDPKSGEDVIKLLLPNGKKTGWIQLLSFSKEDQEYVEQANLAGRITIEANTVMAQSEDGREGVDRRVVKVKVRNTSGKAVTLKLVWLGKSGGGNGIHKIEKHQINEDGEYLYEVMYPSKAKLEVHRIYRGFAVGVTDGVTWIAQDSAQPPHLRFLGMPGGK